MSPVDTGPADQGRYRTRYLKLKSVLYDRSTGLPAFPVLIDDLRARLDERRHLGVLHVEIDNLELVESIYGWQVFDRILERLSGALRECLGRQLPAETLLGVNAVAGDRFAAFVAEQPDGEDVDGAYLQRIGREVGRCLQAAFDGDEFAGLSPRLEFRVGHSVLSRNPFHRFERRLYAALEEARTLPERRSDRRELSWREALVKIIEDSAVVTVFQPVVDLRSHEVLGHEAFSRGPKGSPLEQPQSMFALSSRVGVEAELDRLCRSAAVRASAGMDGRGKVFINVLPAATESAELNDDGFLRLLDTVALDPCDVVLELSEKAADEEPGKFLSALERVKREGFGLAIDDIGTGFSSQTVLESAEPDYLKLDISLVRDIQDNLIKQELLQSLIRIAARIDAAVIAEGVETSAEAATLLEAGAQYGQGYLFSAPQPARRAGKARVSGSEDH